MALMFGLQSLHCKLTTVKAAKLDEHFFRYVHVGPTLYGL